MTNKLPKFLSVFLIVWVSLACPLAFSRSAWEQSPVGRCFKSSADFAVEFFGPTYATDENTKLIPIGNSDGLGVKLQEKSLIWAIDMTPGVNVTRTLLKLQPDGRVCALLFAPFSSSVTFELSSQGRLPVNVVSTDSPPAGFKKTEVVYHLDRKNKYYVPSRCFKIPVDGKKYSVDCKRAFAE